MRHEETVGIISAVKRVVASYLAPDGIRYFRIEWKDTWEPELNLLNCHKALDDYRLSCEKHDQKIIVNEENIVNENQVATDCSIQCGLIKEAVQRPTTSSRSTNTTTCSNIKKIDGTNCNPFKERNKTLSTQSTSTCSTMETTDHATNTINVKFKSQATNTTTPELKTQLV